MRASFIFGLAFAGVACGGRLDPDASDPTPDASPACASSTQTFDWLPSGSNASDYASGLDPTLTCTGAPSVFVRSIAQASSADFGTTMTTLKAADFAGKRVRFRGWVRTQSLDAWAGLWMRVDEPGSKMGAFDNMAARPIHGTTPWTRYDVVLDVAPDAVDIAFGVLVAGNGEAWLDGAVVEVVDDSVPTTGS